MSVFSKSEYIFSSIKHLTALQKVFLLVVYICVVEDWPFLDKEIISTMIQKGSADDYCSCSVSRTFACLY